MHLLIYRTDTRQMRMASALPSKIDPALHSPHGVQPEPLLSLFTSRHPLLSSTINGSLHAYSSSKSYSPSFRYGAEFVERIGSPVVNTVGTAGRISGVETGVRWWLQRSDSSVEDRNSKRRRVEDDGCVLDIERGLPRPVLHTTGRRRLSEMSYSDTLPPYDSHRSPNYEEIDSPTQSDQETRPQPHPSWSSRLIRSTSGLGVAMSEESLESLKWALRCLGWANRHLTRLIISLRDAIERNDSGQTQQPSPPSDTPMDQSDDQHSQSSQDGVATENRESHMQALTAEVIWIIKRVNNAVSEYAGAALPENARILVGRYLKSLRQSFQRSFAAPSRDQTRQNQVTISGSETSARKAMLLAREALDKLAQVSGIVEGTIVSAEEWCERLGRGRRSKSSERRGAGSWPNDEKRRIESNESDTAMTDVDQGKPIEE